MKYLHWRNEGDRLEEGLCVWRFERKEPNIGFILNLDRWFVYWRYSKLTRKIHWECRRREPRAWRILKGKE